MRRRQPRSSLELSAPNETAPSSKWPDASPAPARVPVPFSVFPSAYRESETATQTKTHEEIKIQVPPAGRIGHDSSFTAQAALPAPPKVVEENRFKEEVRITRKEEEHRRPAIKKEEYHFHEEIRRPQPPPTSNYLESRVELDHRHRPHSSVVDLAESEFRARTQANYRKEPTVVAAPSYDTTVDLPTRRPVFKSSTSIGDKFTVEAAITRPAKKESHFQVTDTTVDFPRPARITAPKKEVKLLDDKPYTPSNVSTVSTPTTDNMGYYDDDNRHHSFRQEVHNKLHTKLHKLADKISHHHHEGHVEAEVSSVRRGPAAAPAPEKAPNTVTIPCHHIRLGDILILQGRPCQVIRISTSAATGQHRYLGVDLFTKQLHEESSFVSNPAPSVVVQTMLGPVFKQYRVLDMQDGAIVAMTETGDVKQNLPVIDQSSLWNRLQKAFESGRGSVRVLVVTDHGREMAVDMKVVHGSRL
ncbi:hypothetical protein QBC36DRAFT_385555 [Triangularia setosa]|uniref:Woronin body major protein n=1 Tax=Triangularia setosa TaxID=2587417 RepID=A0AAN6WBT3_9PEZI|nr:hypothetical protein QBC36DRAFT_385555 [Podospora setosa]